MIFSYLKIIFRKFIKEPLYPFISTICLGLGITCTLFVIIWIRDELSYDLFYNKADRIYRLTVEKNDLSTGYHTHFARSWYDWLGNIKENIPGIENVVRFSNWLGTIVMADERPFESILFKTDPSFLKIFSLDLISGNPETALKEPYTVILSESAAIKYFGTRNPIGKTLLLYCSRCPERIKYEVIGVVKDLPVNSHFHFEALAPFDDPDDFRGWAYYYLLLEPKENSGDIIKDFKPFAMNYISEEEVNKLTPHLQKITDIHLFSEKARELERNGSMENIYLFAALALFVLVVAIFNFINLQYSGLIKNFKSLQVMKYTGAKNKNLFSFQLVESFIHGIISAFVAIIIFELLLPSFNNLMGKSSEAGSSLIASTIAFTVPALIILISLTGAYPYLLLKSVIKIKSFDAVSDSWTWKPLSRSERRFGLTTIMISGQYIAAIALIIIVIIVNRQINFFMDNRLGSKQKNIICLKNVPVQVYNKYQVFKSELLSNPLIKNVTSSFQDPGDDVMDAMRFETTGTIDGIKDKILWVYPVDHNFFKFYDIKIIRGSDFPYYYGIDTIKEYYILNKKALEHLGWEADEAVGRPFSLIFNYNGEDLFKGGTIYGVVEDFQMSSMKDEIKPYVFFQKSYWLGSVQVIYDSLYTKPALDFINKTWNRVFPGFPFEYEFVDDLYKNIYSNEIQFRKLSLVLGLIAIILSCLGLWGITGITYQAKTKEIGIRKTHGATIFNILFWLLKDKLVIIAISALIAIPLTYFFMQNWLNNYANRINISWWIFALSLLIVYFIAIITISWQTYKAASGNPIEALRYE
jgi:putative ABC transport system permease protein